MPTTGEEVSLYFHVPFCTKKCPYCAFYVVLNQARHHAILEEGFALEWEAQKGLLENKKICSIYFGGGTPSLFGAEAIGKVIQRCQFDDSCEITVESNPEQEGQEFYDALRAVGVNRISLGVQSLDDRSLNVLGRGHTAKQAKNAIRNASAAGIKNISIDLMYDLPDQTEASWHYTLSQIADLPITHLSLYNLTIEPHTPFHRKRHKLLLPPPESSLRMLHAALEHLQTNGFERYEISAFAKPGFASKHNLGYWTFRPFLGFGPSAFSYWEGERFQNIASLQRYGESLRAGGAPVSFRERLDFPANLKERIAVQLRLREGCVLPDELPEETAAAIARLEELGLARQRGRRVCLTERGQLFYDSVASEIV